MAVLPVKCRLALRGPEGQSEKRLDGGERDLDEFAFAEELAGKAALQPPRKLFM